jgi:hypothetical protein
MNPAPSEQIEHFYSALWQNYLQSTPSASKIHHLLGGGAPIVNDHIALRTFNAPSLGLDVLAQHFIDMGYVEGGDYRFVAKKLRAKHYQHPDPTVPKVFISELLLEECSDALRVLVKGLLAAMDLKLATAPGFLWSGRHWPVSHAQYQQLLAESEYAGWLAAFGFRANHFTVSVNHLSRFSSLLEVNACLKQQGFSLNTAGGEIKGSPAVMLEQSSTMADRAVVAFSDGSFRIPACFYEFAYRYPQADGTLYQGFVEASADKIFESTNTP